MYLLFSIKFQVLTFNTNDTKTLISNLFSTYNKYVRPVSNDFGLNSTTVGVGLLPAAIMVRGKYIIIRPFHVKGKSISFNLCVYSIIIYPIWGEYRIQVVCLSVFFCVSSDSCPIIDLRC